ncbi:MAG: RNA polymerase sigma factor [Bacteroidetes bacterium]|nr:RNA polymerase sigma factor [Bacteroidota bacterium]
MNPKKVHSEEELVAGCVRNDRYFQELLYRRFFDSMFRMCMRYTSDREEGLTILNNGFLRVFRKIDKYSFKGSLEGWIRRLVFHCLSDHFRGKSKEIHFLEIADRDAPDYANALSKLYFEDILDLVDQLPPATREVFVYYAIEGFTHREIAEKLTISEGTSKWHLSSARAKLKELLKKNKLHYAG